jgi:predicted RNA-binding Zn-ribbon protein involved in translation (DUF1610 family)
MTKTPELYCSHCQKLVVPIKGIVNFRCPKCGATFMAAQVEAAASISQPAEQLQPEIVQP